MEVSDRTLLIQLPNGWKGTPVAICRVLPMRFNPANARNPRQIAPAAPQRASEKTFGQLRKLSCGPGVLPPPIGRIPQREDPTPRGGVSFIPLSISPQSHQKRPFFGVFDLHARARLSRETVAFLAFPLFHAW